jgi:hypothetical protein
MNPATRGVSLSGLPNRCDGADLRLCERWAGNGRTAALPRRPPRLAVDAHHVPARAGHHPLRVGAVLRAGRALPAARGPRARGWRVHGDQGRGGSGSRLRCRDGGGHGLRLRSRRGHGRRSSWLSTLNQQATHVRGPRQVTLGGQLRQPPGSGPTHPDFDLHSVQAGTCHRAKITGPGNPSGAQDNQARLNQRCARNQAR